jgi:predicted ATP-grasp superfamily ATP-dependent carboligase
VGDAKLPSLLPEQGTQPAVNRRREPLPVLLTSGGYLGTLAAIRSLGKAGIPITIAEPNSTSVSSWSRYLQSRRRAPDVRGEPAEFLEWLLTFGKRARSRFVLLATCDDTAWLYAKYRRELSRYFALPSGSYDAIYTLLNKSQLMAACQTLGIAAPQSRTLSSVQDLARVRAESSFPVLIKPATQVMFESREKGTVVHTPAAFSASYLDFQKLPYSAPLLRVDPSVRWPLVQEYFEDAASNIYNLSGYVGRDGVGSVFRASRKVLQERGVGVGLCFERAEIEPDLVAALRRLFSHVGYHGVFEVEFIPARGRHFLIDVNPRFYGEMAFDIARGMPLPLLAYFDALDDVPAIRELLGQATEAPNAPLAHTHRVALEMHLGARRLSGALNAQQCQRWHGWRTDFGEHISDAVYDRHDWLPTVLDATNSLYRQIRYPTELLRQTAHHRLGRRGRNGR